MWANVLVDVGGGTGAFLGTILEANPQARGMLFDRHDVAAAARALLASSGVADRRQVLVIELSCPRCRSQERSAKRPASGGGSAAAAARLCRLLGARNGSQHVQPPSDVAISPPCLPAVLSLPGGPDQPGLSLP